MTLFFRILAFILICPSLAFAEGTLTDFIRIKSEIMDYEIQYQVYTPENYSETEIYPTIYVADGPAYVKQGRMVRVLDQLIAEGKMKPIVAVFVDQRDPDNLRYDRRNEELICNERYIAFIVSELVKTIEANYSVSKKREDRVVQGVSFGGFYAACVGLMASNHFYGLSMHSPANSRFMGIIREEYARYEAFPVKIFMSVGNDNDNRRAVRRFKKLLEDKNYDLTFIQNNKDHEWTNWRPLMDDALLTFFAVE